MYTLEGSKRLLLCHSLFLNRPTTLRLGISQCVSSSVSRHEDVLLTIETWLLNVLLRISKVSAAPPLFLVKNYTL